MSYSLAKQGQLRNRELTPSCTISAIGNPIPIGCQMSWRKKFNENNGAGFARLNGTTMMFIPNHTTNP
jgi:hypothetical protein